LTFCPLRESLRPFLQAMTVQYFSDTDTMYIEFRAAHVAETRDLDENTNLDLDARGQICGISFEQAA